MKHKGKSIDTMVCSKRRQKVKNIIEVKDKTSVKTPVVSKTNGEVNKLPEIISTDKKIERIIEIPQLEHKLTGEGENGLNCNKTHETRCDIKESSNESENDFKGIHSIISESQETNANFHQTKEQSEVENSQRMTSPDGVKDVRTNHTNGLSTILENIQGEEKEIKKSTPNKVKVEMDKENKPEVSSDKTKGDDLKSGSDVKMAKEIASKDSPCDVADADSAVIKTIKETNKQNKTVKCLKRESSNKSLKSEKMEPCVSSTSNSRPTSSLSDTRDVGINSRSSSSRTRKPYSGIRFTKQELEYYLPRKSTFNCHEKALRDAGLDLEAIETKRQRRLRRRQPNPNDSINDETPKQAEGLNKEQGAPLLPCDVNESTEQEDEQTEMERLKLEKLKRKGRKKDEIEIKVDHSILLHYLKYVLDNREEYLLHKRQNIQQNSACLNVDPECTIARFGRAFQRGQHGQIDESFLLEVSHGIKANYGDGPKIIVQTKEKQIPGLQPLKPEPETTIDEKDKTEFEKVKQKLDKWLKTITTAQLIKAKELSLKELGEEDKLKSHWMSSLQPCRYLRQRTNLL